MYTNASLQKNLFTDVVIGFEKTSFRVNEGVTDGRQEVCVRVFNPTDNQPLSANIALTIQSAPGTGEFLHLACMKLLNILATCAYMQLPVMTLLS